MSQQSPSYAHTDDVLKSKQSFAVLHLQNYVNVYTKSMSNQKPKCRDSPKMFIQVQKDLKKELKEKCRN